MRILRSRRGFQADHSSSSYLFYAVDHPVNAKGQQIAHRFSSRAEVDDRSARYQKWGESELSYDAHKALLSEHYDVMASESYDWWTLMIAVPRTPELQAALAPFREARGYDDQGVEVVDYGRRLVVVVYCMFDAGSQLFEYDEDTFVHLVELLAEIRAEIQQGNVSFLQAVALFYGADEVEDEDEEDEAPAAQEPSAKLSKTELQQTCAARGIAFRKSWTKDQLLEALQAAPASSQSAATRALRQGKPGRLSRAAQQIVQALDRP